MKIGQKIKKLLYENNLKQVDLIKYVTGKDKVTPAEKTKWSRYLNDKNSIPYEDLKKVAKFLGVDVNYLLGNDSNTIIAHNSHIIHNFPNSKISINEAIESLPHEVGVIVKYMMEFDEKERLKLMRCFFKNCEGDKK